MPQRPCIPTSWQTIILMQLNQTMASGYDLHYSLQTNKAWRAIQWLLEQEDKIVKGQNHSTSMVLLFEFYDFLFISFFQSQSIKRQSSGCLYVVLESWTLDLMLCDPRLKSKVTWRPLE